MTKTISLSDEAYEDLARCKRKGESFSDLARRLAKAEKERRFDELAGAARSWLSEEEAEEWKRRIRRERDEGDRPLVRFS